MSEVGSVAPAAVSAAIPAAVRKEGTEAVDGYRTALQFEGMLLKQMLTEALPEGLGGGGAGEEGSEGEGGAFSGDPQVTSLPETLAESIVGAGGLGLAGDTYKGFEGVR